MKISELAPRTGNADVEGTITAVAPERTFSKFGKDGRVANATLQDDSGSVTLTLWNDQIDQVKVGDRVRITKGWVSEWQGENQLSTGKFGSLEIVSSGAPLEQKSTPGAPGALARASNAGPLKKPAPKGGGYEEYVDEDADDEDEDNDDNEREDEDEF